MNHPLRQISQQASLLDVFYRIADAGSIFLSLLLAAVWANLSLGQPQFLAAISTLSLFYVTSQVTGMYRKWNGVSTERELFCTALTWSTSVLGVSSILLILGLDLFGDRTFFLYWMFVTPVVLITTRILARGVQRILRVYGFNNHGFAIIGINELGIQLADNIKQRPDLGLNFIGYFDDRPDDRLPELNELEGKHEGDLSDLLTRAKSGEIKRIYITFPMRAEDRIRSVLDRLGDTTASVYIVPDFFVFELLHARWTDISGLPVVSVFESPLYGVDGMLKRSSDLVLGTLALMLFSVPMFLVALAVKLTSKGPVIFKQKRYGMDGHEILVWKFRSMTVCENSDKVTQATKNDARITPVGAFIRSTSLDELPQLFNVLGGSMSLVGPRPHATAHNEEYRKVIQGYMLRHKIKPGITGLAQVSGWRGETDTLDKMEGRIQCDHEYIRHWSFWMDISILFRTVFVVLKRTNAH
ncbi:MAG: undecaprenyl-phosphate glucose phosphotransferase [Blastopirellula sp.]|nr:MAG: undecaprenyl-phosphate glucose phosphotransferase [Blastopirellula sp.]